MSRDLHQVIVAAAPGDAITNHALTLRGWLRELGFNSDLYALHIHPQMEGVARPFALYRPARGERMLIFHHSIGSEVVGRLVTMPLQLMLVYHNITPAHFLRSADPMWRSLLTLGREQLQQLQPRTLLGLGVSPFNREELQAAGYRDTGVLPLVLDTQQYDLPPLEPLAAELRAAGPLLLFVGRLAPNKRQEDLVKLLYYLRRIRPDVRLALVGQHWLPDYTAWLRDLVRRLDLEQAVLLPGAVLQQELVTYYRSAALFVSMSEHEGFCMPLIESMYLGLPVLAYDCTAIPGTLAGAGLLFRDKHYPALAELVDLLLEDSELRQRVVSRQRQRAESFLPLPVKEQFVRHLRHAGLLPG